MKTLMCNLWRGEALPKFSNDAYGLEDVLKLWRNARRHVEDLRLVCMVDKHYYDRREDIKFASDEEAKSFKATAHFQPYEGYGIGGWSNVMECFRPELHQLTGRQRAVVVGLDTVFVGNSDWLWQQRTEPVSLPMDPFYNEVPCDAVITFDSLGAKLAWRKFVDTRLDKPYPYKLFDQPSEMMLLRSLWDEMGRPAFLEGNQMRLLQSFKACKLAEVSTLPHASVVYFHGKPKPKDLDPEHPVRKEWER